MSSVSRWELEGELMTRSRMRYKDVRTREENLSTLKRSQASLASKIDSQEKKVRSCRAGRGLGRTEADAVGARRFPK